MGLSSKVYGSRVKSETIYASIYKTGEFECCDCPGFVDSRGEEFKLITSINMRLVVEKARSIRAIIVVIEYPTFQAGRGQNLIELSQQLGVVFKDVVDCEKSVIFVYSKVPKDERASLLDRIEEFVEVHEQKAQRYDDEDDDGAEESADKRNAAIETMQILRVLKLMKSTWPRSVAVDLFSDDSQKAIMTSLRTAPPIPKEQLCFQVQDSVKGNLDRAVFAVAELANRLLERALEISVFIGRSDKNLAEARALVATLTKQINESEQLLERRRSLLGARKLQNEASISKLKATAQAEQKSMEAAILMIDELSSRSLEVLWEDSFQSQPVFGRSRKDFEYVGTKGFDRQVVKTGENTGKFLKEVVDPDNGIYRVQFRSKFHAAAKAYVALKIERCLKEPNPASIRALKHLLVKSKLNINGRVSDDLEKDINALPEELRTQLRSQLTKHSNDSVEWYRLMGVPSIEEEVTQLQADQKQTNDDLAKLQENVANNAEDSMRQSVQNLREAKERCEYLSKTSENLHRQVKSVIAEIEQTSKVFESLDKLILIVGYNNELSRQFLKLFKEYRDLREKYNDSAK